MNICDHIKNLEQRLLMDEGRRDIEFIHKVLADNFTELGSSGHRLCKNDMSAG